MKVPARTFLAKLKEHSNRVVRGATGIAVCLLLSALAPAASAQGLFQSVVPTNWYNSSDYMHDQPDLVRAQDFLVNETQASFFDVNRNYYMWLRHIEGQQVGNTQSFSSAGITSYVWLGDDQVLMLTGQGLVTNEGMAGGSAGAVYRQQLPNDIGAFGVSMHYDANQSRNGETYQQIVAGLEFLRSDWRVRAFRHFVVGDDFNVVGRTFIGDPGGNTPLFLGNNLVTGGTILENHEHALDRLDIELGRALDFVGLPCFEAYGAWYNLDNSVTTNGYRVGMRGLILSNLSGEINVASDDLFGTTVYGGLTLFVGGEGGHHECVAGDFLTVPVQRETQVAVYERRGVVAFNNLHFMSAANGSGIRIVHVNSDSDNGDGTFENPLGDLSDVFDNSRPGDVIFVHGGSEFMNDPIVLKEGQQLVGEGLVNLAGGPTDCDIRVLTNLGLIRLPESRSGARAGLAPVIRDDSGNTAVTVADNTRVANLEIDGLGSNGTGIGDAGAGASDVLIECVYVHDFSAPNGFGLNISPATRTTVRNSFFENNNTNIFLNATDTTLRDLVIRGGDVGISLGNAGFGLKGFAHIENVDIDDMNDVAIHLNDARQGFMAVIRDVTIDSRMDDGLRITNSASGTFYNIDNLDIGADQPIAGFGVDIQNSFGTFDFDAASSIIDPTGTAFNVNGGAPVIVYRGLISQSAAGRAVEIQNLGAGGSVMFTGQVEAFGPSTGVRIADSSGDVAFADLDLGRAGNRLFNDALTLQNNMGTYTFADLDIWTNTGDGLIATAPAMMPFELLIGDGVINTIKGNPILIDGATGMVNLDTVRAKNAPGTAVVIQNSDIDVNISTLDVDGATLGILVDNIDGDVVFDDVNINRTTNGIELIGQSGNTGSFTVNGGTIDNITANGITITDFPTATIQNMRVDAGSGHALFIETTGGLISDSTINVLNNVFNGDTAPTVEIFANGETASTLNVTFEGNTVNSSADAFVAQTGLNGGGLVLNMGENTFKSLNGTAVNISAARTPAGASVGVNFLGSTINDSGFIPPDSMGAVGPSHIVEFLNGVYAIYDKTGNLVSRVSLDQFWIDAGAAIPAGNGTFDPRIVFDPTTNRWFATAIDGGAANNLYIAVSNSADPTAGFTSFQFVGDSAGARFNDYDTMGVDAESILIATNNFGGPMGFDVSLYTIPKADLISGVGLTNLVRFENLPASTLGNSIQGVVNFDSPSDGSSAFLATQGVGGTLLHRTNVSSSGTAGAMLGTTTDITVGGYAAGPLGRQPAPGLGIENVSPRFTGNVVEVDGSLYAVHAIDGGGSSAIRLYEIDKASNTVLQEITISDPNLDFLDPSVAVNDNGDIVIGMTGTGPSQFASAMAVIGTTVGGVTQFGTPFVTAPGVDTYSEDFGTGRVRWGDYSATVVDPTDSNSFWTFQELAVGLDQWGVQITQLNLSAGTGGGPLTINRFANNTVLGTTNGTGGVSINGAKFDADLSTDGIQAVMGGTLNIGSSATVMDPVASPVNGDGLAIINSTGDLRFDRVDIVNKNGTGLLVQAKQSDFNLEIAAGKIDTTGGAALDLDPLTVNLTFDSITSVGGPVGIAFDDVQGSVEVLGLTRIANSGDGITVTDSDLTLSFGTNGANVDIRNVTGNAVSIMGSDVVFNVTQDLLVRNAGGNGLFVGDSDAVVNIGRDMDLSDIGSDGIIGQVSRLTLDVANDLRMTTLGGDGIDITGRTLNADIGGLLQIDGAGANGIMLTQVNGTFDAANTTDILNVGVDGIRIDNSNAAITFGGALNIVGAGDDGIEITGASGNTGRFLANNGGMIDDIDGDAIHITDYRRASFSNFDAINAGNGSGVVVQTTSTFTSDSRVDLIDNVINGDSGPGISVAHDGNTTSTLTMNVTGNTVTAGQRAFDASTGGGGNLVLDLNDNTFITSGAVGIGSLGGSGIREGFNANTLAPNDDLSTGLVPIGFNANFFGTMFSDVFVNNNGNVTFNNPLGTFTPFPIVTNGIPMIAPFFADVDTTSHGMPVTYGTGMVNGRNAFGVNYLNVDYFLSNPAHGTQLNDFQMILIDRSDINPGDFDIEFNYGQITWETGDASGGTNGLGGSSARVGFTNGVNMAFELPGSGVNGAFLDSGPAATSLINNSLNSSVLGQYVFTARGGNVSAAAVGAAVEAVNIDGSGGGPLTIRSFSDNTSVGTPGGGGMRINAAIFDSNLNAAGAQQVDAGTLTIGSPDGRAEGDGLVLIDPSGSLHFDSLDVYNSNGTGVTLNTKTSNTTFALDIDSSTVDTSGGTALMLDPATVTATFDDVRSVNALGSGIVLDEISGTVNFTNVTVINAASDGVQVQNSNAAVTIANLNVNGTGNNGVNLIGRASNTGSFTALGGTIESVNNIGVNVFNYPNVTIRDMEINAGTGNAVHIESATGFVGRSNVTLIDNVIRGDDGAAVDVVQNGGTASVLTLNMTGNDVQGARSALDATTGGGGGQMVLGISDNMFTSSFPGSVIGLELSITGDTLDRPWTLTNISSATNFAELRLDLNPVGLFFDSAVAPVVPTDTEVGLATVNGAAAPGPNNQGTLLTQTFTDFNPGETYQWLIDVDFNSNPAVEETVIGSALAGTAVSARFADGTVLTGQLNAVGGGTSIFSASLATSAININGSASNSGRITVTDFSNNNVQGSDGSGGGINFNTVFFDRDLATTGVQQVSGGNTVIGSAQNPVEGNGLTFNNTRGDIGFDSLEIVNTDGTGLDVSASSAFNLDIASSTIDTTNGPAVDLTSMTTRGITLDSVSSTDSLTDGISLTNVRALNPTNPAQVVTITDANVSGAADDGLAILNSRVNVAVDSLNVRQVGGDGVSLISPNSDVTFGTVNINNAGNNGVVVSNPNGDITFADLQINGAGNNGVTLTGSAGNTGSVTMATNAGSIDGVGQHGVSITNFPMATIQNMEINAGSGSGVDIQTLTGYTSDSQIFLLNNMIFGDNGPAVNVISDGETSAAIQLRIEGNTITAKGLSRDAHALHIQTGRDVNDNGVDDNFVAGTVELALNNNIFTSHHAAGVNIDGTLGATDDAPGGEIFITEFANNEVRGTSDGEGGVLVNVATFDAILGDSEIQQVQGGSLIVGTDTNFVRGNGLRLLDVAGDLQFDFVDIHSKLSGPQNPVMVLERTSFLFSVTGEPGNQRGLGDGALPIDDPLNQIVIQNLSTAGIFLESFTWDISFNPAGGFGPGAGFNTQAGGFGGAVMDLPFTPVPGTANPGNVQLSSVASNLGGPNPWNFNLASTAQVGGTSKANGGGVLDGANSMTLTFNDFDPGEEFDFIIDVLRGGMGLSGDQFSGSRAFATFSNGVTLPIDPSNFLREYPGAVDTAYLQDTLTTLTSTVVSRAGLHVDTAGTLTHFNLQIDSGDVTTKGGEALSLNRITADITLDNVTSIDSQSQDMTSDGIVIDEVKNGNLNRGIIITNATIINPVDDGLVVVDSPVDLSITNLTVRETGDDAVVFNNADGTIDIGTANISLAGGDGIVAQNSDADITFQTVNINGANNGIDIDGFRGQTGSFQVTGTGTPGDAMGAPSGGVIQNVTGLAIAVTNYNQASFNEMELHAGNSSQAVLVNTSTGFVGDSTVALTDNNIFGDTGPAVEVDHNGGTASDLNVTFDGNNVVALGPFATSDAFYAHNDANGTLILDIQDNTVYSLNGTGMLVENNAAGRTFVTDFSDNTVSFAADDGVVFDTVIFDANPATLVTVEQVSGGNLNIGSLAFRVEGDGLRFDSPRGEISFDNMFIFNDGPGTGLEVNSKTTNFNLINLDTSGTSIVDTTNGTALDLDPLRADLTFDIVRSTNAMGDAVIVNQVRASGGMPSSNLLTIGTLEIDSPSDDGLDIDLSLGTIDINGGFINNVGDNAVEAINGSVSGIAANLVLDLDSLSIDNPTDDGLNFSNITFNLNNSSVDNVGVGGDTIVGGNSILSGSGNTANNYSEVDNGGNSGVIIFNGGADIFP